MAITGFNGDNETNIGLSKALSYNIYDENKNEIPINSLKTKIEFWIPKDPSIQIEPYKFIDTDLFANNLMNSSNNNVSMSTNQSNHTNEYLDGSFVDGFNLDGWNSSLHIQIKPVKKYNLSVCYLFLLKFKSNPVFNLNKQDFDEWSIFCPKGKKKIFINLSKFHID